MPSWGLFHLRLAVLSVRVVRFAQTAFSDWRSLKARVRAVLMQRRPTWISLFDPKTLSATVVF